MTVGPGALVLVLLGLASGVWGAEAWSVQLSGRDLTREARPLEAGGVLTVDLSALAPILGVRVDTSGEGVTITNASAQSWSLAPGSTLLSGTGTTILLPGPADIQGARVRLPVEIVAEIAGRQVQVEHEQRRIRLADSLPGPKPVPDSVPEGWDAVAIAKSPGELEYTARMNGSSPRNRAVNPPRMNRGPLKLPDSTGRLRIQSEQSYIFGADGGTRLAGDGKLFGYDTHFNTIITEGRRGLGMLGGRAGLADAARVWEVQAGDLFSPLWGFARGLSYARQTGNRNRVTSSLYLKTAPDQPVTPIWSLRDDLELNSKWQFQGETTSDGSLFGRTSFRGDRLTLDGFGRDARSRIGRGYGGSISYLLPRNILVSARSNEFGLGVNPVTLRSLTGRLPVWRRVDLFVESTWIETIAARATVRGATLSVPFRTFRVRGRYATRSDQRHALDGLAGSRAGWREWMTAVSWTPHRWVTLDSQYLSRSRASGENQGWDQLLLAFRPSRRLSIHWMGRLTDPFDDTRLRTRVQWQASETLYLGLEYGQIPTFQNFAYEISSRTWRINVRKDWGLNSPIPGAEVRGVVLGARGRPAQGVVVEVGEYAVETDEHGEYQITGLPKGSYAVKLREQTLPAGAYASNAVRLFEAGTRGKHRFDLLLGRLGQIRGVVFIDVDEDGEPGFGEGLSGIPVFLADAATSTSDGGEFEFTNLPPGRHEIRLDPARLPPNLQPASAAVVEVILSGPDPGSREIRFRLERVAKPIVFQDEENENLL